MNRKIKFRAFFDGHMYNGHSVTIQIDGTVSYLNNAGEWVEDSEGLVQLMQSTGLKDKNGLEIYEGDILKVCNGSINAMSWLDKPYVVEYKLTRGFDMCMFCWDKEGNDNMDSTHWCEVIGNIYETPELLNS